MLLISYRQRLVSRIIDIPADSCLILEGLKRYLKPETLVFEVNDMPETKMVDREKDGKIGPESEINDRSGPEPKASGGNSMAAVDRASTYSDPDKDKQFDQKGSDRIVSDTKVVEVGIKKSGHKLADDTQKVTKKVKDKI